MTYDPIDANDDGIVESDVDNDSVSTESANITNAPTGNNDALRWQEGVESGTVTADGVDNSTGNDDWGQAKNQVVTVTFANAFSSKPDITVALNTDDDNVASNGYQPVVTTITLTGFVMIFQQFTAVDNSGTTDAYAADYIATEGR